MSWTVRINDHFRAIDRWFELHGHTIPETHRDELIRRLVALSLDITAMNGINPFDRPRPSSYPRHRWDASNILVALFVAIALFLAAIGAFSQRAHGQEIDRGEWFRSLRTDTGASCCGISDCGKVEAKWADGQWWAKVPRWDRTEWERIPPGKVLDKESIDEHAYLCNSPGGAGGTQYGGSGTFYESAPWEGQIYCFVPPNMGF